ncbi:hypothetical protein P6144_08380 [Sphingomonas sp. HITSZ_GF]|uniref:hypothetical protein n=1 Tax=Sphingomonas sp. HITSZ_GF TaxID=3037247 RepID=UPI00240CEC54|nr:hypothetical protein [Sphingomonas sp. HITSZ_GF]MDG2533659.1 hypothetical protein [Sphingomonas sp. HITSZ_GF]
MRLLTLFLALVLAVPALAADAAGNWAVRSHGRVVMLLKLEQASGEWRGTLSSPEHFTVDGNLTVFTDLRGVKSAPLREIRQDPDGALTFATGKDDQMRFRLLADGTARLRWLPFEAEFVLDRAEPDERLIRFDPQASYPLDRHWTTNAEMTALFDADQKAREDWDHADHARIEAEDRKRRARARELLDVGALESGADYYHAAFLFQHGDTPDDYLLAHALALAAGTRGYPAGWIAAATLDRYLQTSGQPQIFGTQYQARQGKTTQQPFAPALIPDSLRKALNVPVIGTAPPR